METTILTFSIRVPFSLWVAGFDSAQATEMHKANGVTPLYRGMSTEDPSKVVVIHQAAPGVVRKMFEDNKSAIAATGHVVESTVIATFVEHAPPM